MTAPGAARQPDVSLVAGDKARVDVYAHGAHVTSWIPAGSTDDRLFVSATSEFGDHAAIRGGIPIIFPQFASRGPLPKHGFARTLPWGLAGVHRQRDGIATVTYQLGASRDTLAVWPYSFRAEVVVTVGGPSLTVALTVTNMENRTAFSFTAALHTYLRVNDVRAVSIEGLEGIPYEQAGVMQSSEASALRIDGEVDRIYCNVPRALHVRDATRATIVSAAGFPDVVVWNPGPVRGASLADLEPTGYARFVCVEAAAIGAPVQLAPGERWTGAQTLTAE